MPAMESMLESRDGWESIGLAVESVQQRRFDFGGQPPVFFFSNEGGSLSAPLHPPKRIAPGIGEQRRKQRKEQAANYYSGMMEDVIAAAYAAVLVAAGSWMVHCQQAWNWRE
jgi:hypothetical protein